MIIINMINKKITLFTLLLLCMAGFVASCDETDEISDFSNWPARNSLYIDSIAKEARANVDNDWKVFLAYGLVDTLEWDNKYYVYCKVLQQGDGTDMPHYNDSVLVNYRGRLIPTRSYKEGYIFDESYSGNLDVDVDVPVKLNLAGCVRGWTTAMTNMVKGDTWRIYVPAELGYGLSGQGVIPANSTLIFDLNLVDFASIGTPLPQDN